MMAKIGIGSSNPLKKLHVYSADYNALYIGGHSWFNGRIGIKVPTSEVPKAGLHLFSDGDDYANDIMIETLTNGNPTNSIWFAQGRGSWDNPQPSNIGDNIGGLYWSARTSSGYKTPSAGASSIRSMVMDNYNSQLAITGEIITMGTNVADTEKLEAPIGPGVNILTDLYLKGFNANETAGMHIEQIIRLLMNRIADLEKRVVELEKK
jgi:hypothetical protein